MNTRSPPNSEPCVFGIHDNGSWYIVEGDDVITVRFFINGGFDCPRIRLRAVEGDPAKPNIAREAVF